MCWLLATSKSGSRKYCKTERSLKDATINKGGCCCRLITKELTISLNNLKASKRSNEE